MEREADAAADAALQKSGPGSPATSAAAAARSHTGRAPSARSGEALPRAVRAYFEPRFGHDFSDVRVHTDGAAADAARAVQARAYTTGSDVVFGAQQYAPDTPDGTRLLAHELAHVLQQRRTPARGLLMRQPLGTPQGAVRPATLKEATDFLHELSTFIEGARSFAQSVLQPMANAPATPAARTRAHGILNQQRLRDLLTSARQVFAAQEPALQGGSPDGTAFRVALLDVLAKIRAAAPLALAISNGLAPAEADAERAKHVLLEADLIEADPFTSAGLAGTPSFGAAESAAGTGHEAFIESYLDELIAAPPGQGLAASARDAILERIEAGLRRAFLTIGSGAAGPLDVRRITNPRIAEKYGRAIDLLSAAVSARPPQLSIITDSLPPYALPADPVPDVTPQLHASSHIGAVDFSRVPATELPYVRHGVLQAANTTFAAGSTNQLRDASWPVVLHVRHAGTPVDVRYDLIFDAQSNVRVERLGEVGPREVAPTFAALSTAGKAAQLVTDFGLAGVDGRPASAHRPASAWSGAELDQVKAAYDLLPAGDRPALHGVTIVRDSQGPAPPLPGQVLQGFAHTSADPAHDDPGPPAHGPPHIHYYDAAFSQNAVASVGPPGATGPGADWTLVHEVGHMRIFEETRRGNAAIDAANVRIRAANAGLPALNAPLPPAQHAVRQAYGVAQHTAAQAVRDFNAAVAATPPPAAARRAQLLQVAQGAIAARNQATNALRGAGVPPAMVSAATALNAGIDALLAASQTLDAAEEQIPTFVALAGAFGFAPFTDYARRSSGDEFFAETYALFLTDPTRLRGMNRSIFQWFAAGMPMDRSWTPPP